MYYRTSIARSKAAAQQVANLFGSADIQPMPLDGSAASKKIRHLSHGAMLVVVVGKTYKGNMAPAPKDTTPARTPPAVTSSDAALPYLRTARRYVPFRLQNPTVIERHSVIDSEKPVRVYTISGGHKAVRLTFHTYGYQYWGIEETDWTGRRSSPPPTRRGSSRAGRTSCTSRARTCTWSCCATAASRTGS